MFGRNSCLIEFLYILKHQAGKPSQPDLYDDIFLQYKYQIIIFTDLIKFMFEDFACPNMVFCVWVLSEHFWISYPFIFPLNLHLSIWSQSVIWSVIWLTYLVNHLINFRANIVPLLFPAIQLVKQKGDWKCAYLMEWRWKPVDFRLTGC